jgi:hypothetical protein
MRITSILLITILVYGCRSDKADGLTGMWRMYQVLQDGKDVTSEHDPYNERYLKLESDSTFESGGRPFGTNTGTYIYHASEHTLILDSNAGPEDDSQWKVSIQGDTMHWKGYGSEWADGFELMHVKKKP